MNELNVYYYEGGDNKQPLRLGASKARFLGGNGVVLRISRWLIVSGFFSVRKQGQGFKIVQTPSAVPQTMSCVAYTG